MAQSTFNFIVQDAVSSGSGGGGQGGGKGSVTSTDEAVTFKSILSTLKQGTRTNLGLQFSVAAILKQSQIFTGFIGSLFQILGAFVDVALMSVFPLLKSSLKFLMKFFDPIKTMSAALGSVVELLMRVVAAIGDGYNKIRDVIGSVIDLIPGLGGDGGGNSRAGSAAIGGLSAAAKASTKAGASMAKKFPVIGAGVGIYEGITGFQEEGMAGLIKSAVDTTLAAVFGAGGFALGTALTGGGGIPGAIGGVALYDLIVKDVTQNFLNSVLGGAKEKQIESQMYSTGEFQ